MKADSDFSAVPILLGPILALMVVVALFIADGLLVGILALLAFWVIGVALELRWIDRHDSIG